MGALHPCTKKRRIEWQLTPTQNSLTVAKFIMSRFEQDGAPTHVTCLLSSLMFRDVLVGESFSMAKTLGMSL